MTPRRLVLLRHGQTAWNKALRVQGQIDADLDDTGRAQAEAVAPVLATLDPTLLWSSDLARARDTASYVEKAAGLAASYDARLRETHLGERQGLTHDEYAALDPVEFAQFRQGHYDAVPGAERTAAVRDRMVAAVTDLRRALAPGETGIAVSHGAAIRVAVGGLLGWPADQYRSLRGLGNCGWVVLVERPGSDGLALEAYNRAVPTPDFTSATSVG
ncbi:MULTISPECIES: histidine phosphatase family protein [unclassified Nocardioides]|uniref:histidine phosphatase family protein n=1 Tax=unclassified Nocardioides TaxID=2615069 RepID=UPI0030157B7C